jgi:hypothetical protein
MNSLQGKCRFHVAVRLHDRHELAIGDSTIIPAVIHVGTLEIEALSIVNHSSALMTLRVTLLG